MSHDPTGWFNLCERCTRRYWVRAADLGRTKMRRFVSPDSDDLHECQGTTHAD